MKPGTGTGARHHDHLRTSCGRDLTIGLRITVPGGLPPPRAAALLAVASHCTVHNTLRQPPDVSIELAGGP
jgi:putative redox protein